MQVRLNRDSFLVWAVAPAICTVIVLWYQFGFSMGAMLEEWGVLALMQQHPSLWSSFPGQVKADMFAARPLQILPHFIAREISGDSFLGFHLVLMVGCVLRIIGGAWLGNFLFRNKAYAAAFGLLCFAYPADTQQFEFRTVHIVFSLGLVVFGSACMVSAFTANTATRRWAALVTSAMCSCVAVLIYEPFITLYLIAPLALLSREGFKNFIRLLKHRKGILAASFIAPLVNAAYLFYAIVIFKSSYQVNASGGSMTGAIMHNLHYLIDSDAYNVFYDAWVSTWWILTSQVVHYRFIVFTGIALLLGLLFLTRRETNAVPLSQTARYVLSGLILVVVGYLPFMVAESHMVINQRTFMSVAPGASMIVIAVIAQICRRSNATGIVIAAGFIFFGFVAQLYQFDRYTRDYTGIVLPYTSMLADQTDPAKRVHLVFDQTGFGGHLEGMYENKVQHAANVRQNEDLGITELCLPGPQSEQLLSANCSLKDGNWVVRSSEGIVATYPRDAVQIITIGPGFDSNYRSRSSRWRDYGHFVEAKSMFRIPDPHAYQCVADSMWGYSGFCRGQGWSDGVFNHDRFRHTNFITALRGDTSLLFALTPSRENYVFKASVYGSISADTRAHMQLLVNGTEVKANTAGGDILASVPPSLLKDGLNKIEFLNVKSSASDTGLALTRVDLAPVGSPQLAEDENLVTVALGRWIDFSSPDTRAVMQSGFSATESKGTWTDGASAQMTFLMPAGKTHAVFVGEAIPFFNETHKRLAVSIEVNGQHVADQIFTAPAEVVSLQFPIKLSEQDARQPVVVRFSFDSTARPSEQDKRDLGLYFTRFRLTD